MGVVADSEEADDVGLAAVCRAMAASSFSLVSPSRR